MKYFMYTIVFIFISGCSTLHCTKFGVFEYCAPTFTSNMASLKNSFDQYKTKQEKSLDSFVESKELQREWLATIRDVAKYLKSHKSLLYGDGIIPAGDGMTGQYEYSIKIIHENDNVTLDIDDSLVKSVYKESMVWTHIIGKERVKKYPELLFKAVPTLKTLLQLEQSKNIFAKEFDIVLRSRHESKILSEYYLDNKHKVYISSQHIAPQVDVKGNLYLPNSIIENSKILKLIMIHEAFHLLPVGINNEYIAKSVFGALTSEKFAHDTASTILNTPSLLNSNKSDRSVTVNPLVFDPQVTNILESILDVELFIDGRVLSYIEKNNDLCNEYYNLLKSVKLDKAENTYQRERLPLIKDTCEYMKDNSFTFSTTLFRKEHKNSRNILLKDTKKLMSLIGEETNPKIIINIILSYISKEIVSKNYHREGEQKIMLKWYSKILQSMMYPAIKKMEKTQVKAFSNMDEEMLKILSKGK